MWLHPGFDSVIQENTIPHLISREKLMTQEITFALAHKQKQKEGKGRESLLVNTECLMMTELLLNMPVDS